jgi:hypothetical protein
LNTTAAQGQG